MKSKIKRKSASSLTPFQQEVVAFMREHDCFLHSDRVLEGGTYIEWKYRKLWDEQHGRQTISSATRHSLWKKGVIEALPDNDERPWYRIDYRLTAEYRQKGEG